MKICQPLSFYFPASVICIDDDTMLLHSMELGLPADLNIVTSSKPLEALNALLKQPKGQACIDGLLAPIDDSNDDTALDCPVNVHLSRIIDIAYNNARFSEIAVLVVDQSMPEVKGLELCEKLNAYRLKKIMLTSETDRQMVVEAFNQSLIDHFIAKTDAALMSHLESAINYLRKKYFQDCSALILGAVCAQEVSFVRSPLFLKHFNAFLEEHHICEFYLLDSMGSYLGLDAEGQAYWFLVKSEAQMVDDLNTAVSADEASEITQVLKDKKHLLYCLTSAQHQLPVSEWSSLLHPVAYQTDGFYISIIKGSIKGFKADEVLSFNAFRFAASDAR